MLGTALPAGQRQAPQLTSLKGKTIYITGGNTGKVIVARAFAPASTHWKYAGLPFDPEFSEHATHVAGIAAA